MDADVLLLRELEDSQAALIKRIKVGTRWLWVYGFIWLWSVGAMVGSTMQREWGKAVWFAIVAALTVASFFVLQRGRKRLQNAYRAGEVLVQTVSKATGVQPRLPEPSESEMRRIRKRLERDLREMGHK